MMFELSFIIELITANTAGHGATLREMLLLVSDVAPPVFKTLSTERARHRLLLFSDVFLSVAGTALFCLKYGVALRTDVLLIDIPLLRSRITCAAAERIRILHYSDPSVVQEDRRYRVLV
jgi:hypothetical protein